MKRIPLPLLLVLASCGPLSVQQAERACLERAQLAESPHGSVQIGATSRGKVAGGVDLNLSSDYLLGKDPARIFETCVVAKSGQAPTRPYHDLPGWKG